MNTNLHLTLDGDDAFVYTGSARFDPERPSALFVHGAGMDHTVWTLPSRYFARHGLNALAVDLPGHGRSGGAPLESIEAMADWLARVLDAVGVDTAAAVGHSMGSLAAFDLARRHPDRVRALALVGSTLPMAVSDALLDSSGANSHDAIDMLTWWGYSRAAWLGGSETPGMWMAGNTLRLLERAAPGVLHNDLAACNAYRPDPETEQPVETPTLLIQGDRDMMTPPKTAANLRKLLPNARIALLPGSGHSLMMERPDALLDALIGIVGD